MVVTLSPVWSLITELEDVCWCLLTPDLGQDAGKVGTDGPPLVMASDMLSTHQWFQRNTFVIYQWRVDTPWFGGITPVRQTRPGNLSLPAACRAERGERPAKGLRRKWSVECRVQSGPSQGAASREQVSGASGQSGTGQRKWTWSAGHTGNKRHWRHAQTLKTKVF